MSPVSRYPSVPDLLRPDQVLPYKVARWFVSGADEHRRSGRSLVLAAAFLTEGLAGRSAQLWDHYAGQRQLNEFRTTLRELASVAGLEAAVDTKFVLRKVVRKLDCDYDPESVRTGLLAEAVKEAYRSGMSKEEILAAAAAAVHEEAVTFVSNL